MLYSSGFDEREEVAVHLSAVIFVNFICFFIPNNDENVETAHLRHFNGLPH